MKDHSGSQFSELRLGFKACLRNRSLVSRYAGWVQDAFYALLGFSRRGTGKIM